MNRTSAWDWAVLIGVVLTVLAAPTQYSLRIPTGAAHTFADIGVAPADVLLAVTAVVWGIGVLAQRRLGSLRWPPPAAWIFLALCVPSVFWAGSRMRALAELAQYFAYFFVGYLVLVNVLATSKRRAAVVYALLVGLALNLGLAAWQYLAGQSAVQVGGALANRNLLGAYFCLLVPLASATDFFTGRVWLRLAGAILAVAPLFFIMAGGPFLALLVSLGIIIGIRNFRMVPAYLAAVVVLVIFIFPALPRNNAVELSRSLFLYDEQATDEGHQVARRYLEWQAGLKSLDSRQAVHTDRGTYIRHMLLGQGLGVYEKEIGRLWGAMPDPKENVVEPDSQNQYVVLAVSAGLPAALAFVWLLVTYARGGWSALSSASAPLDQALAAGTLAAMVAIGLAGFFTVAIARGVGLILVTLAATAAAAGKAGSQSGGPS